MFFATELKGNLTPKEFIEKNRTLPIETDPEQLTVALSDPLAVHVIDALRANNTFSIASVAPMLLQERPKVLLIRFQGEGEIDAIAKNLKEAVRWIGEARTKPNPVKND